MKYLQKSFSTGVNSKKFRDNWEETFGKKKSVREVANEKTGLTKIEEQDIDFLSPTCTGEEIVVTNIEDLRIPMSPPYTEEEIKEADKKVKDGEKD